MKEIQIGTDNATQSAVYRTNTVAPNTIKQEVLVATENTSSTAEMSQLSQLQLERYATVYGAEIKTDADLAKAKEMAHDAAVGKKIDSVEVMSFLGGAADSKLTSLIGAKSSKIDQAREAMETAGAVKGALSSLTGINLDQPWLDVGKLTSIVNVDSLTTITSGLLGKTVGAMTAEGSWSKGALDSIVRAPTFLATAGKTGVTKLLAVVTGKAPAAALPTVANLVNAGGIGMIPNPTGFVTSAIGKLSPAQLSGLSVSEDILTVPDNDYEGEDWAVNKGIGPLLANITSKSGEAPVTLSGRTADTPWFNANTVGTVSGINTDTDWRGPGGGMSPELEKAWMAQPYTPLVDTTQRSVPYNTGAYADPVTAIHTKAGTIDTASVSPASAPMRVSILDKAKAKASDLAKLVVSIEFPDLLDTDKPNKIAEEADSILRVGAVQNLSVFGDLRSAEALNGSLISETFCAKKGITIQQATRETYGAQVAGITSNQRALHNNVAILNSRDPSLVGALNSTVALNVQDQLDNDIPYMPTNGNPPWVSQFKCDDF